MDAAFLYARLASLLPDIAADAAVALLPKFGGAESVGHAGCSLGIRRRGPREAPLTIVIVR